MAFGEHRSPRISSWEARALREHCQHFSRLGWALFAQGASALVVQVAAVLAVQWAAPALLGNITFLWVLSTLSVYGVGFPLFVLIAGPVPTAPTTQPRRPLGPVRFFQVYLIGLALLYLSNLATLFLLELVGMVRGEAVSNPVESIQDYPVVLNLVLGCLVAPFVEEVMFRKVLLDRLRPYGDRFAVGASALCFGLFHGNFNQIPYAAALGLVFGYVALRTGCLWQTILLHAMVNFIATGLIPLLELWGDWGEELLGALILGSIFLGVVFLVVRRRELRAAPGQYGLSQGRTWRLFFENPGVIVFCLLALLESLSYFL